MCEEHERYIHPYLLAFAQCLYLYLCISMCVYTHVCVHPCVLMDVLKEINVQVSSYMAMNAYVQINITHKRDIKCAYCYIEEK